MTAEAQRIVIAQTCGWIIVDSHRGRPIPANLLAWERGRECVLTGELPDYPGDLNAIHEAEKVLTDEQMDTYMFCMESLPSLGVFATAAQRAEAFLKCLNKWTDV